MHIFLYEFITGGGLLDGNDEVLRSLEAEGRSMVSAVARDLIELGNLRVASTRDARLTDFELPGCTMFDIATVDEDRPTFQLIAANADATLVIAPELDGNLYRRTEWVEAAGGRLLSPRSKFVAVTGDKMAANRQLTAAGVQTPPSRQLAVTPDGTSNLPRDFDYPAVVKRIDGAGSVETRLWHQPERVSLDPEKPWMIERYCAGIPASVAVLCGPNELLPLPPFRQEVESGSFSYRGGKRLTDHQLIDRAKRLAVRAIRSLRPTTGYVGVDLVLGEAPSGSGDFVIEINPRLTTSYIGLRAIADGNLAAAMLDVAAGRPVTLSFNNNPVEFAVGDASPLPP